MPRMRTALVGATVTALASIAASAEEMALTLDPEATRIHFTLGATLHRVEGTARLERGEIRFDPETGAASGRVIVRAASADTGGGGRDRDMHEKVLESGRFAEIAFAPERVEGSLVEALEGAAGGELSVSGSLEIHGASHPLTMEVTVVTAVPDSADLEVTAVFRVPYVAWGMKDPSKFVLRVAKEVEVRVEARGRLERQRIDRARAE